MSLLAIPTSSFACSMWREPGDMWGESLGMCAEGAWGLAVKICGGEDVWKEA